MFSLIYCTCLRLMFVIENPEVMVLSVNYGRNGNNLPSPKYVIYLYQRCGIEFIRLYEQNRKVLEALQCSNLLLSLGVRNQDLKNVARSQYAANELVKMNIVP